MGNDGKFLLGIDYLKKGSLIVGEPAEHHDAAEEDLQPCGPHTGGRAEPLHYPGKCYR